MISAVRLAGITCFLSAAATVWADEGSHCWPGFVEQSDLGEQVREMRFASGARAVIIAPDTAHFHDDRPTQLVIYATPNGNTIEQTLGCRAAEGLDWHFDIQHAAAQVRQWREMHQSENVVLACVQADNRSWPTWRQSHAVGNQLIHQMVSAIAGQIPSTELHIVLTGHSGGGSFITGYVNAVDEIPDTICQIAYLDANYSYSTTEEQHGRKFLEWLRASPQNHFLALAYDDREIELNGKKVVGPTGGTYRASHRMLDYLREQTTLEEGKLGEFSAYRALDGRLRVLIHSNPENKILHTRLVGEMNGLLYALALGADAADAEQLLGTPRKYTEWVQPAPFQPAAWLPDVPAIPRRRAAAPTGSQFAAGWSTASTADREAAISSELLNGNVPGFLRRFCDIKIQGIDSTGIEHEVVVGVLPDYLSLGTDEDFLRIPMSPTTAQCVADAYGCLLPTRKLVDAIYSHAELKIPPHPLTEDRETLSTFAQHQEILESQLQDLKGPHGRLIAGIKKDVVVSNELTSRHGHVAIYGWHQPDGTPIQPLTTVHVAEYVDYSHGVRLVSQYVLVDGKPMRMEKVLKDETLHTLLSDEGPLDTPFYSPQ